MRKKADIENAELTVLLRKLKRFGSDTLWPRLGQAGTQPPIVRLYVQFMSSLRHVHSRQYDEAKKLLDEFGKIQAETCTQRVMWLKKFADSLLWTMEHEKLLHSESLECPLKPDHSLSDYDTVVSHYLLLASLFPSCLEYFVWLSKPYIHKCLDEDSKLRFRIHFLRATLHDAKKKEDEPSRVEKL